MANAKVIVKAESDLSKGLSKAKLELQDFGKAAQTIGSSISKMISSHAGIAALVGSVAALGAAAKACADEYLGAARENERFEATMKNLSATTGVSTRELQKLADAYEQTTFFTAEAIQASGQLLLATNEISQEVFPRALEATMDLAEAMGQDVTSAASSMQKALAQPEEGLKALRTAGINFTDEEEDLIKSLVEANKKLEAQELILQKVEERYSGVAQAVADTPVGKLDAIKDTWSALQENIGEGIINSLSGVFDWILTQLQAINDFFDNRNDKKEVQRLSTEGISDISDYVNAKTILEEKGGFLDAVAELRETLEPIWTGHWQLSPAQEQQRYNLEQEYGVEVKFDPATQTILTTSLETLAETVKDYEKTNPEALVLTRTLDELKTIFKELEASDAARDKRLEAFGRMTNPTDASKARIAELEAEEKLYNFLKEKLPTFNTSGGNGGSGDNGLWLGDAGSVGSSNVTNPIPSTPVDFSSILGPQQDAIDSAMAYLESSFLSTLDSYDRKIYEINGIIEELSTIELLSPLYEDAQNAITKLKGEISNIEEERAQAEADAKIKAEEEAQAEIQRIIDKNLSFVESKMLSTMDAYDTQIYDLQNRIIELNSIDPLSPLKEDADALIAMYEGMIADVKQARIDDEKAKTDSEKVKGIKSQIGNIDSEEDVDFAQLQIQKLLDVGTEEALELISQLTEDINEYYRKLAEEAAKKRAEAADIWETEGFSGLTKIFDKLEQELTLPDIGNAFLAEFSREREFDFGGIVDSLSGITDAAGPLLDILLSTNPAMSALEPIIQGFVDVIGPAIDTTIAPLMDFLTEIGTMLGEMFLPIFDALRPSLDMIAEILRMFITPVLQILEPIIGAVVMAFDMLSPAIAAVGLVLTPLAAALEFIMDMFGYLGDVLITFGENIGIAFYNLLHWANPKSFKTMDEFSSDAFDNFGSKMDKWFTMMENDSVVSDSVSTQVATTNATYTGAMTVHLNIYQNAPVVGENGMTQFAMMIRDKFEELDYYAA